MLVRLAYCFARTKWKSKSVVSEFAAVARWCLWITGLIIIATVSAGFYAYYTVKHDAVSHAVIVTHQNWALSTAIAIFLMTGWSLWRYVKRKNLTLSFVIILLLIQGLLTVTAWYGAELVFRYGIGIMSLPQAEEIGHEHHTMKSQIKVHPVPLKNQC